MTTSPSHPNGSVLRPTDTPPVPARVGGVASPSPGNPFLATAVPASTSSVAAPDPFAKLASGLLDAAPPSHQPRRKTDKSDFFQETPKPSLLHLSKQQQPQQQHGDNVTEQPGQQTDVDLFGATPVSVDTSWV